MEKGYYCFGWGDRDFYPSTPYINNLEWIKTVKALFLPSQAAMRITLLPDPEILRSWSTIRELTITETSMENIAEYVLDAIILEDGKALKLPPEKIHPAYENSLFIEAEGTYSLFTTCNNWTNRALKAGNIPTKLWTPLAWQIGVD